MQQQNPVDIPQLVKQAVHTVVPTADLILFGSRARGDFEPDSDWDFLVLTDEADSWEIRKRINERLFVITADTGELIYCSVSSREDWNTPLSKANPFQKNVVREGVPV